MASIRCASCKGRHGSVAAVRACHEGPDDAGLVYAEAVASWVTTGGNPADAHRYAAVIARGEVWAGWITELPDLGECEHGLSQALCVGPSHYPTDL